MGSLRERNRLLVIDALRRRGRASRSELARLTGLSRTTVGSVVSELQGTGLVVEHELGSPQPGRGRPPVLLRLDAAAGVAVGISFDHDEVWVALGDLSATVLGEARCEIDVDHSASDAIDLAVRMVHDLRRSLGVAPSRIVGAGVGLPGPIDRRTGAIGSELILPGWAGLDLQEELTERLGLHVELDNDANLGALAEATFGAGRGLTDVLYMMLGAGVGAGLVLGGRIHRGAAGLAGEIGHVQVQVDGAVCRCGSRGCLETVVGELALRALLRPYLGDDVTSRDLIELVDAGDLRARRVVNDAGRAVGRVLADLCNGFNPEAIVVGGQLSEAEPLLSGIRETIDRYALPGVAQAVKVLPAQLGDQAEVIGALALVIGSTKSFTSPALGRVDLREEVLAGST
jgi:predicted NBD/HSP70 family sugar kinase